MLFLDTLTITHCGDPLLCRAIFYCPPPWTRLSVCGMWRMQTVWHALTILTWLLLCTFTQGWEMCCLLLYPSLFVTPSLLASCILNPLVVSSPSQDDTVFLTGCFDEYLRLYKVTHAGTLDWTETRGIITSARFRFFHQPLGRHLCSDLCSDTVLNALSFCFFLRGDVVPHGLRC